MLIFLPSSVDKLRHDVFLNFRMPQLWSARWTHQVVWTLTLCCISLSVYEPEQCFRWDSVDLCPWIGLSHIMYKHCPCPKWHKMIAFFAYTVIANCVLDAAVPVCNVAVWNRVQREWLHCCCDSRQPRYPQRVRWGVRGGILKTSQLYSSCSWEQNATMLCFPSSEKN